MSFSSKERYFNFLNLLFNMNRDLRPCFTKCHFTFVVGVDVRTTRYLDLRFEILNNIEAIRSFSSQISTIRGVT